MAAWDIDVRPDFKGLPKGSGSVEKGQELWEAKCAHCHGVFGESNEVFSPLIGGTSAEDIKKAFDARANYTKNKKKISDGNWIQIISSARNKYMLRS